MTINLIWQILCRLNKAQELHETARIHLSAFIPWLFIESYHPVFLKSYATALPSSSSPHFFNLTFTLCSTLQISYLISRPKSVILLMYAFNLKLWKCREAQDRKSWESWLYFLAARTWQEGASWVYWRSVLFRLRVTTKGWVSQSITDTVVQQCGFKEVRYHECVSYNLYKYGTVSEHWSSGRLHSLYND